MPGRCQVHLGKYSKCEQIIKFSAKINGSTKNAVKRAAQRYFFTQQCPFTYILFLAEKTPFWLLSKMVF